MKPKLNNKKQSFLEGAMVLVIATGLVKIIGAIFKIPLGNLLGELGSGYFQNAYDLYLPIYSLAMAGLPIAVSRMVADSVARNRYRDARQIFRMARRTFLITGLTGFVLMLVVSYPYVLSIGGKTEALPGILTIAPSILFCCVMSSYRGYYEGLRNMTPTAVSQVIEAMGKLVLGLGFAYGARAMGLAVQYQAAGAILGITIGTLLGAIYLWVRFHVSGDGITRRDLMESPAAYSGRHTVRLLAAIAIPVVLGSMANQIASLVDAVTVQNRLTHMVTQAGMGLESIYPEMMADLSASYGSAAEVLDHVPTYLYGCYKVYAFSIFNLVPTLTSVLGISALPALTTAWASRSRRAVRASVESVLRITSIIVFPCGLGMSVLSSGVLNLLFHSKPIGAAIAAPNLFILGFAAIFAGLVMPMTNMLQAIGKQKIPVRNIIVGAMLKIVVNFALVGIPTVNIHGASAGTLVCYMYMFVMNFYALCKYTKLIPNLLRTFVKPLAAGLFCAAAAWAANGLLGGRLSGSVTTIAAIAIAGIVYLAALILLRVLTKDDILMLPKGKKIAKTLEKLHWIG